MRLFCVRLLLGVGALSVLLSGPVLAQFENVKTVEGPQGDATTLTARPHSVAEGLAARAMGIARNDTTQWALSLIGAAPDDTISLRYGDTSLPIERVSRPEDGVGPTKVFVSKETFLTMAEMEDAVLTVGTASAPLPEQLRREMKYIFERVP